MKKRKIMLLAAAVMLLACGCQEKETIKQEEAPAAEKPAEEKAEPTEQEVPEETEVKPEEQKPVQSPEEREAQMAAYQEAVRQLAEDHVFPDGTVFDYDNSFGSMEQNAFAVCDVDSDGKEELILCVSTTCMAGMAEKVYGYSADMGELYEETCNFPAVTYYSNGILKADASHNHGMAGEQFWPYTLYYYDPLADQYDMMSGVDVDAWDRSFSETDYEGESYPEEIDTENAGIVMLITESGVTETISKSDYEKWLEETLGDAVKISPAYQAMTEKNIQKMKEG